MPVRAYVRLDPDYPDHKGAYPDGAIVALTFCFCFGAQQPKPGTFRNRRLLAVLLDRRARWIGYLIDHEDLIERPDGSLYVEGWDQWQEGNWQVAERMRLVRQRKGIAAAERTPGAQRTANWRLRKQVLERDEFTCRYCGNADYERDWLILEHVIPDGPTTLENLVTACRPCNKRKGGRTPAQAGMPLLVTHHTNGAVTSHPNPSDAATASEHVARAPRESALASAIDNGVSVAPPRDHVPFKKETTTNGFPGTTPKPADEELIERNLRLIEDPSTSESMREAAKFQLAGLGVHR